MSEFSDWQSLLDIRTKANAISGKLQDFFLIKNDNSKRVQTILEDKVSRLDAIFFISITEPFKYF